MDRMMDREIRRFRVAQEPRVTLTMPSGIDLHVRRAAYVGDALLVWVETTPGDALVAVDLWMVDDGDGLVPPNCAYVDTAVWQVLDAATGAVRGGAVHIYAGQPRPAGGAG